MPEHLVLPYESFGPIRFDMRSSHVPMVLGEPDRQFEEKDGRRVLHYRDLSLRVDFRASDPDGYCLQVEQVDLTKGYVPVLRDGLPLTGDRDSLMQALWGRGHELMVDRSDKDTVYCRDLGISLWRETSVSHPGIDTVMAFSRASWASDLEIQNAIPVASSPVRGTVHVTEV